MPATTSINSVDVQNQRRRERRRRMRREKAHRRSLLHFSTFHIVLGVCSAVFQMIHFTNQTILSSAESGLWCGLVFISTGLACVMLNKSRTTYSLLTMVAFSLLSLFMALTLSSVSWIGMNASSYCQYVWDQCEANRTQTNGTLLPDVPFRLPIMKWAFELSSEGSATIDPDITSELCDDIEYHYLCGFNIGLGKTMHSLLMLVGLVSSMTSFILVTVSCTGATRNNAARESGRISQLSSSSSVGRGVLGGRPITPWEFPPPSKEPLPFDQYPNEPPPVYEQYEHDIVSHL